MTQPAPAPSLPTPAQISEILRRVAEEAAVFEKLAPLTVSEETLRQRSFEPLGKSGGIRSREIISEYGYTTLAESPGAIHELRTVVSVDGKPLTPKAAARRTLTLGLRSPDDRVKKRMLDDFARLGLAGAATDFGQLVLLFTRNHLQDYNFGPGGENRMGADTVLIVNYRQVRGPQSLTVFAGRQAVQEPLTGQIWVRASDFLPLRVAMVAARRDRNKVVIRDEAVVEYTMSPHGVVLPAAVVHREYVNNYLGTENLFQYTAFRKFGADAEIRFDVLPEPAPPPQK